MDKMEIYSWLDDFFGIQGFKKVADENLKYVDHYYIDVDEKKYLFICKVFENKADLIDNWKIFENRDIALYLQNKKFAGKDIRWDMYFLLISKSKISAEDIARIERNKYCCKKFIINALSQERLKEELNLKLPFTDDFYKLDKLPIVSTAKEFFNQLREKNKLPEKFFTNDLLRNFDNNPEKIIDYFKYIGGEDDE
ncbi:MAG: hypothetical protein KAX49_19250 [Halanaerobiales bacterium]|nr:hypothetical protein [Halanaerobiales bacterium]